MSSEPTPSLAIEHTVLNLRFFLNDEGEAKLRVTSPYGWTYGEFSLEAGLHYLLEHIQLDLEEPGKAQMLLHGSNAINANWLRGKTLRAEAAERQRLIDTGEYTPATPKRLATANLLDLIKGAQ